MVNTKPLIIIQARMGSSRLPEKVMRKILDKPMIGYQLERLKQTNFPIVVATSIAKENDALVAYIESLNIDVFRGSEDNVLERYYYTAKCYKAQHIIRITGDNPLVDAKFIVQQVNNNKIENKRYYISEGKDKKLPLGMSFEMFPFSLLEEAYLNANTTYEKEHVTPYLHQNFPGDIVDYSFLKLNIEDNSSLRLTVDTEADFKLLKELIEKFNCHNKSLDEIMEVFRVNPKLKEINSGVYQKKWNE